MGGVMSCQCAPQSVVQYRCRCAAVVQLPPSLYHPAPSGNNCPAMSGQGRSKPKRVSDKMQIGSFTLVCDSYTQDDKPNYSSEWAVIDVYRHGKKIDTMFPERRFRSEERR